MIKEIAEELVRLVTVKVVVTTIFGSVATYVILDQTNQEKNEATSSAEVVVGELETQNTRSPSSLNGPSGAVGEQLYKARPKITAYNKSNFVTPTENKVDENYFGTANGSAPASKKISQVDTPVPNALTRQIAPSEEVVANKPKPMANLNISSSLPISRTSSKSKGQGFQDTLAAQNNEEDTEIDRSPATTTTSSTATPLYNSCSPDIVGGSFGNPIAITLQCIYPSTIKYCLAQGSCCDPESDGLTYASQVVVGPQNGDYCLSFSGQSDFGGNTTVYQHNYTINTTYPNLTVNHPKVYYQSTELDGTSFIHSNDFGKLNYSIGQINLNSHDPGPGGYNYDCDEIISNYVALPAPTPLDVLSLFDVSLLSTSSQVEIPLRPDLLSYGDNFITSYIMNNNYVAPLYSCSTTAVNLSDFEYFQADVSQSWPGANSVMELEGQFTAYGFFEEETNVYRGPAGAPSEDQSGENLKSGMYGVFY